MLQEGRRLIARIGKISGEKVVVISMSGAGELWKIYGEKLSGDSSSTNIDRAWELLYRYREIDVGSLLFDETSSKIVKMSVIFSPEDDIKDWGKIPEL